MERTFYPGSEGEQTDNGMRIRGFYGMKKSKDAKYGDNGCADDTHTRLKFGFDSNRLARRPDRWPSPIKSVQSQSNV